MFPWSGRQKVLRKLFVSSKNARFYLMCHQPTLHELAWTFDARNLCKKLVQVSWLCVTTISQEVTSPFIRCSDAGRWRCCWWARSLGVRDWWWRISRRSCYGRWGWCIIQQLAVWRQSSSDDEWCQSRPHHHHWPRTLTHTKTFYL